ncbi:hypothetical protein ACP70R_042116 [Stipagrostis hirtigluma subsp. patula]
MASVERRFVRVRDEDGAWVQVDVAILDPQLLIAARRGDESRLRELLGLNDHEESTVEPPAVEAAQVQVVVRSEASSSAAQEEIVADHQAAASSSEPAASTLVHLLDGVTRNEDDSLLHVVAASGDGKEFLDCAAMIYDNKRDLLGARNRRGETPLHCAAGARNANMLSYLVDRVMEGRARGAPEILEMLNRH